MSKIADETLFKLIHDFLVIYLPTQRNSIPETRYTESVLHDPGIRYRGQGSGTCRSSVAGYTPRQNANRYPIR